MALKLNYQQSAMRICVDEADAGRGLISGRVVSQRLKAPMEFSDINDMLVHIDLLMDEQKFPQAFQRSRSFFSPDANTSRSVPAAAAREEMLPAEAVGSAFGKRATLLLHVATRQRSTWQGFVDWLDGQPRQPFSSTLEFIRLLEARLLR